MADLTGQDTIEENDSDAEERYQIESRVVGTSVAGITAFELMSNSQIVTVDRYVTLRFELSSDQFIINRYGLPFIPIPEPRHVQNSSRYLAVPRDVSHSAIVTHPIYWTAEEVLGEVPSNANSSSAQEWSIRMFSFLLLCGCYSAQYNYKDYLSIQNIEMFNQDGSINDGKSRQLMTYIDSLGAVTIFDNIEYLTYDSIIVDPKEKGFSSKREFYEDFADKMVAKCDDVLNNATHDTFSALESVLNESDQYLFENEGKLDDPCFEYDSRNSYWSIHFRDDFFSIKDKHEKIMLSNGYSQELAAPMTRFADDIEKSVEHLDNLTSALLAPILAADRELDVEAIAAFQSYNRMAVDTANRERVFKVHVNDVITSMSPDVEDFSEGDTEEASEEELLNVRLKRSQGVLDDFLTERRDSYAAAWQRLFLNRANYDRATQNLELYSDFGTAQWELQTSN